MNKHINWKRFDWNNYLVKLFDNPFGRAYLGVPQGKKIHKITESSAHYYTGEKDKNGRPIICTGYCFSGGKRILKKILKLAKVVSCFAFLPIMPKALFPLIVLSSTGDKFAGTATNYGGWTNEDNIKADDGNFAQCYIPSGNITDLRLTNFGFSIPSGSTINGVEEKLKGKVDSGSHDIYGGVCGTWGTAFTLSTTNTEYKQGGSTNNWPSLIQSYTTDDNFYVRLEIVDRGIYYYIDCVKINIYYTEVVAPTVTTQDADQITSDGFRGNGNITDTGGANCTRRGFCYKAGTSGDPTTSDSVVYDDGDYGTGAFTKSITGLSAGTSYRVRAYAVNSAGTSYGTTVDVKTLTDFIPQIIMF
jgi:hypothetical protein